MEQQAASGSQGLRLRNIYAVQHQKEYYEGIKASLSGGTVLRCNDKYFGVPWVTGGAAGGGAVSGNLAVFPLGVHGKVNSNPYLINASTQQLLDFDFYPFEHNLVATATRDPIVKVWRFPRDGVLIEDMQAAQYYLAGHERKVDVLRFHPLVSDLLLTASSDCTIRLWDFRTMREMQVLEGLDQAPHSTAWSYRGTVIAHASRDGTVSLFDPRAKSTPVFTARTDYLATKSITVSFASEATDLLVTGFAKSGDRELALWDGRNLSAPLSTASAGNAPGALQPFVDPTINAVYVASKGEGMRVYEVSPERRLVYAGECKTDRPQTAVAMLPKTMCNVDRVEVALLLKLSNENYIQTFSLRVPRKSAPKYFQEDLFPPAPDAKSPAMTLDEWTAGKNTPPVTVDMKPEDAVSVFEAPKSEGGIQRAASVKRRSTVRGKTHSRTQSASGKSVASSHEAADPSVDASMAGPVLMCTAKGGLLRGPTWEKRFLSVMGARLHISQTEEAISSLATIPFADVESVLVLPPNADSAQLSFALATKKGVTHTFKADSIDARDDWVAAISVASGTRPTASHATTAFADLAVPEQTVDLPSLMEGEVEVHSGESWWWGHKWTPRYLVLQEGLLSTFTNAAHAADPSSTPLETMRLYTVILVKITNLNASYEEPNTAKRIEGFGFQINTPERVYFFRTPTEELALRWTLAVQKVASIAVLEHRGQLDDESHDDELVEMFGASVDGYLLVDGSPMYLSVIAGNHYHFKSHLSTTPTRVVRGNTIQWIRSTESSPPNGFLVRAGGDVLCHIARTDQLRRYWLRKLLRAQELHLDLVEALGLQNVQEDKALRTTLDADLAQRSVDVTKVKSGESPMLIMIASSKRPAMQVPLSVDFIFKDCCYVLDAGDKVYVYSPPNIPRVNAAKGADLAHRLRLRDRGGNAVVSLVNDEGPRALDVFAAALSSTTRRLSPDLLVSLPDDLEARQRAVRVYRVTASRDTRKQLRIVFDSDEVLPSKSLLETENAYVIDAGTELFVWTGANSGTAEKRLALYAAARLAGEEGRAPWTFVTRILENTETSLFKEKFADYPSSLMISMQPAELPAGNTQGPMEQPPIDIGKMHADASAVPPQPQYVDNGTGRTVVYRIIVRVNKAGGYIYDKAVVPRERHGQFYSGHSYVVLYYYMQRNMERCVAYFWQGHESSIVEKGASAVETVNLTDDAPDAQQVRVVQGKEPAHFLLIFKNALVVHAGKEDGNPRKSLRLYQLRDAYDCAVRCVEYESIPLAFNSDHATVVVHDSGAVFCWQGKFAADVECRVGMAETLPIHAPGAEPVLVKEGQETEALLRLIPTDQWEARVRPRRRRTRVEPRLFLVSEGSGVVTVEHVAMPTQQDLDGAHVMILDTLVEVFVWIGEQASKNEKILALETVKEYVAKSPRGHSATTLLWVTFPYHEPVAFCAPFHGWTQATYSPEKRGLPERCRPLDTVLEQFKTSSYPYSVLAQDKLPEGVDRTRLEEYLSDDEFTRVFNMSRAEFQKLPAWKQSNLKKAAKLF